MRPTLFLTRRAGQSGVQGIKIIMSGERILIADDELPMVQFYTRLLSERGYQVRGTNKGEEALACLEEEQFDLLLVNFKLMCGFKNPGDFAIFLPGTLVRDFLSNCPAFQSTL